MDSTLPSWQRLTFQLWQQMLRQQKIPHAILLYGAPGLGKSALVKAMLQELWCESSNRCGNCRHCHWLLQEAHPDLHWLQPEAPGKAIKIDTIREANDWLQLSPLHAQKKFLVIQSAENLNTAASNALLKTLEEPPPSGFIFLIAEMPQRLLATVRSRCYKMPVALPDEAFLRSWLAEQMPGAQPDSLIPGLGPYALLDAFSGEKKAVREKIQQNLEAVSQKKIGFLAAAEILKPLPPVEVLTELYEWMLRAIALNPLNQKWFDFEKEWLSVKRSLLSNQNLNWQLQLELLLERL